MVKIRSKKIKKMKTILLIAAIFLTGCCSIKDFSTVSEYDYSYYKVVYGNKIDGIFTDTIKAKSCADCGFGVLFYDETGDLFAQFNNVKDIKEIGHGQIRVPIQ